MTAKDYLSQARYLDTRINSKIKQLEALNDLANSATATLTGMPHNPNKATSKLADTVVKIVDLQREINDDIDKLVDLKSGIRRTIETVQDNEQKALLEMRYLNFITWEEIAVKLGYSMQHTYRIHDNALKSVALILKDESKCD